MRLQSIQIQNFRCFDDLTIEFEKDLNVIVAVNGGGKTTILDALSAAFIAVFGEFASWHLELHLSIRDIKRLPDGSRRGDLLISTTLSDDTTWKLQFKSEDYPDEDLEINLEYFALPKKLSEKFSTMKKAILMDSKSDMIVPVVAYYQSTRNLDRKTQLGDSNRQFDRFGAFLSAFEARADYSEAIDWFYAKESQELRANRTRTTIETLPDLECVRRAVTSVLGPAEGIYFTAATPPKPALKWRVDNGTCEERLLGQLSDGYRNMLALVMDFARRLAQANPQLPNPLEAEAIMLVDEIDLHLHPKWQQTIIGDLQRTFPNTQLIVTTHSPQVLTTVESRCIRILEDGKIRAAPPASQGSESVRMLERIMKVDSRPPGVGKTQRITELMQLISDNQLDDAQKVLAELQEWSQGEEPALDEAEMAIENRRWEESLPE